MPGNYRRRRVVKLVSNTTFQQFLTIFHLHAASSCCSEPALPCLETSSIVSATVDTNSSNCGDEEEQCCSVKSIVDPGSNVTLTSRSADVDHSPVVVKQKTPELRKSSVGDVPNSSLKEVFWDHESATVELHSDAEEEGVGGADDVSPRREVGQAYQVAADEDDAPLPLVLELTSDEPGDYNLFYDWLDGQ